MRRLILYSGLLAAYTTSAWAQGVPEGWQIGAFGSVSTSPLVGDHADAFALPYLSYETAEFSLGVRGARFVALSQNGRELELLLRPRFPLIDEDEPEFAGMSRDITFDLGASVTLETGPGSDISLTALQGVSSDQQGHEIDLRFNHRLGRLPVSVYAGAAWQSDELTEYLYGVRPGEAAAGRPTYAPGAALTPYIGIQGFLPVSARAAIIGTIEAVQFPDAITDSPIVEDNGATTARVGIVFNF